MRLCAGGRGSERSILRYSPCPSMCSSACFRKLLPRPAAPDDRALRDFAHHRHPSVVRPGDHRSRPRGAARPDHPVDVPQVESCLGTRRRGRQWQLRGAGGQRVEDRWWRSHAGRSSSWLCAEAARVLSRGARSQAGEGDGDQGSPRDLFAGAGRGCLSSPAETVWPRVFLAGDWTAPDGPRPWRARCAAGTLRRSACRGWRECARQRFLCPISRLPGLCGCLDRRLSCGLSILGQALSGNGQLGIRTILGDTSIAMLCGS